MPIFKVDQAAFNRFELFLIQTEKKKAIALRNNRFFNIM